MTYVLLLVGFVLLIKGADYFVEGASKLAQFLRVSPLLIGLTIVAFGTSAPEATVSFIAALEGSSDVAIGNVVGSNIFNATFILGVTAMVFPLAVQNVTVRKEIPFALLAAVALLILISDVSLQYSEINLITRTEGFILLLFFAVFLYYIFEMARENRSQIPEIPTDTGNTSLVKNLVFTFGGLLAIVFGGDLVVKNSTQIALSLGMSETLVGLTIVAVGTSLPELVTSITAALKKQSEIALGNIVGSNIFNIFFVLGASAVIHPLAVDSKIFLDMWVMVILTILLLVFSRTQFKISKIEGANLAIIYIIYLAFIILRN
ncbi:calcium/sodium antiporter [Anaerobacillus isosaccharinicus]|uniref:Calcium/sodium antiporter n=1 Tax=Anaerobacillus isosaccharinicus TaxID=1532552 RepID=A0A7S7L8I2_9BACI|nr:calcium/sodium antiporter [Anaerobacillus isosaccharinicus]MBA5585206.1 calcium/sodium antiporter [Anaerobacillus isosaccharinicus]QOY36458.1 calcium/sodium antiporter [Anaerobacillus isosaccharinicus]